MWLKGWRTLWAIWAVAAVPIALLAVAAAAPITIAPVALREKFAAERGARKRAQLQPGSDEPLRRELLEIRRRYQPDIDAAGADVLRAYIVFAAAAWALLAGGGYAAGAAVAWMRRYSAVGAGR